MWQTIINSFDHAVTMLSANVYWLTLSYLLLSEFGAPIPLPGNMVLVAGGFLLGQSSQVPLLLMALAFAALVPGAITLYWVGRQGGIPLLERIGSKIGLPPDRREKITRWLDKRAISGLIVLRLLPTVRVGTTILPGALGMPWSRYVVGMGSALIAWVVTYIGIGYLIGLNV